MYVIPLNDTTEARYGEMARIMVETNNWLTPMMHYDLPFLGKPPLSIWLSALSMKLFGISAFAARLPNLILSIGILLLVWHIARQRKQNLNSDASWSISPKIAVIVLAGSFGFILDAGTVMTDPALLFCVTLMTLSFWHAVMEEKKIWGYTFFIAAGLGLLAKGPVALVLAGLPIFFWTTLQHHWRLVWKRLPWFTGILITMIIAVPWYCLAEMKNPGFLNYFIVGENIHRFLDSGWAGDRYGNAHAEPLGMIWIFSLLSVLPWTIPAIVWLFLRRKEVSQLIKDQDGWVKYLLCCFLLPLLFFTFAHNIIFPYAFLSIPAFALLFAELAKRSSLSLKQNRQLILTAILPGIVFLIGSILFTFYPELVSKSQNRVVQVFEEEHLSKNSRLIYWNYRDEYSAQFYSGGRAYSTLSKDRLCELISNNTKNYVVINAKQPGFPEDLLKKMKPIAEVDNHNNAYWIFKAENIKC